jgi:hypothetical protein
MSENSFGNTYAISLIAQKGAVIDLQIVITPGGTAGINSPTLEVACSPPGIGAKKIQERSRKSFVSTYRAGGVALKCGAVDHRSALMKINSSALGVACPPPGIGAKI